MRIDLSKCVNCIRRRGTSRRSSAIAQCGLLVTVIVSSRLLLFCATPDSRLPPITRRAMMHHHVGKVVWVDLANPDPEIAKRFLRQALWMELLLGPQRRGLRHRVFAGSPPPPSNEVIHRLSDSSAARSLPSIPNRSPPRSCLSCD